jgi:ribosomal protein S18 acetylase RimI-like enzyme
MEARIEILTPDATLAREPALVALLQDAVDGGASIGFLPPLGETEAAAYWRSVVAAMGAGARILFAAAQPDGQVVGTAQLDLATRPNARHRAEVQKVIVHRRARRRGIGRALMLAVEAEARRRGRTTLVLDTRRGDPSERLYATVGYRLAGVIPEYAQSADGALDPSAFYYRLLGSAPSWSELEKT